MSAVERASRAYGRASGPGLMSEFLVILENSGLVTKEESGEKPFHGDIMHRAVCLRIHVNSGMSGVFINSFKY